VDKAFTASGHKRSTHLFNQAPNPGAAGMKHSASAELRGRFAIFVGGFRSS